MCEQLQLHIMLFAAKFVHIMIRLIVITVLIFTSSSYVSNSGLISKNKYVPTSVLDSDRLEEREKLMQKEGRKVKMFSENFNPSDGKKLATNFSKVSGCS